MCPWIMGPCKSHPCTTRPDAVRTSYMLQALQHQSQLTLPGVLVRGASTFANTANALGAALPSRHNEMRTHQMSV